VSGLEQETLTVASATVPLATYGLIAAVRLPGTAANFSLANIGAANQQFKSVRIRGIIWATGTPTILTIRLLGPSGAVIGQAYTQNIAVAAVLVPMPFEWVDTAPLPGVGYSLQVQGTVASTASSYIDITGYNQ
jgi:hypothetical protein